MAAAPVEAAFRHAGGTPGASNPLVACAVDRIGTVAGRHRDGGRKCIIGPVSSLRFPKRKLLILAVAALMVSGCGIVYRQPIYQGNLLDKSAIDQLQPGMSKQQVIGLLGSPSIADPFHNQRWDYTSTQRTGRTGQVERKNLVLHFENDTLARWDGDYFPEQDEQLAKDLRRSFGPNLAKDKKKGR
jgi:outer membrane protein assembly factor BamE